MTIFNGYLITHKNPHQGQIDFIRGLQDDAWDLPAGAAMVLTPERVQQVDHAWATDPRAGANTTRIVMSSVIEWKRWSTFAPTNTTLPGLTGRSSPATLISPRPETAY